MRSRDNGGLPARKGPGAAVGSKDTDIELALRNALWAKGLRYRKNVASLPGKPDIVFLRAKLAVFCDGEFWHNRYQAPKQGHNAQYWTSKLQRNVERDREQTRELRRNGWTVLRFWGEDILQHPEACVSTILEALQHTDSSPPSC